MQSTAPDVNTYLESAPADRQTALARLRGLCQEVLAGYDEQMAYGMPAYLKNGVGEVAFASQKNYISLYILKEAVVDAHRAELAGLNVGKGCIRYSKPEKMNFELIERLLIANRDSDEAAC